MSNFDSPNARVNRTAITKVASVYDQLSVSNREEPKTLSVTSFLPEENASLNMLIDKTASCIEVSDEPTLTKEAFFSGGLNLFTATQKLIANKLGVSDEIAHQLTSAVLNKAEKIKNQFGGDDNDIIDKIVDEMSKQVGTSPNILGGQAGAPSMKPRGKTEVMNHIETRLINELGMSQYEAERYKHSVFNEVRDLTTMLRPHTIDEISDAVLDTIIERHDPSVIYGMKDSSMLMNAVRSHLS